MQPAESLAGTWSVAIGWIERFVASRGWRWKLVAGLAVTASVLSVNPLLYSSLKPHHDPNDELKWQVVEQQSRTLLMQPAPDNPGTNEAKRTFRLTVPLLMKILHLNRYGIVCLQFVASLLFLYFTIRLVEQTTGDRVAAVFAAVGFAFIYTGSAGLSDALAWFDEFAYLFILLAMYSSNVFAIVFFTLAASWTDERGFIACAFVFLWWKLKSLTPARLTPSALLRVDARSTAVLAAMLAYLAGRFSIQAVTGLHTPHDATGLHVFLASTNYIGLAVWSALEGFWVPVLFSLVILIVRRRIVPLLLLTGLMTVIMIVALSVHDITRSAGYMFPAVFISILVLSESTSGVDPGGRPPGSLADLRILLSIAAVISVLCPSYIIVTLWDPAVTWYEPAFIKVLDLIRIHFYGH